VSALDVFAAALAALDRGRGVAIASVIAAHGSTPRHVGARMAVATDGEQWGTIGGGRIEQLVVTAAREVAAGALPRVVRQHLVRDLAMCCGGSMEIVLTAAAASREALGTLATGSPHVVVTPLDGGPITVRAPRPGDPPAHRAAISDGALLERVGASERAIVFGFGHVARSLGPVLAQLGFEVIVCDDGETGAVSADPAWASEVPWVSDMIESFDVREVERRLGGFRNDDRVLIVTRDHAIDQQLLEQLITRDDVGYLGMIGSRGKVGRFRKRLDAKGLLEGDAGVARWARLRAPIGLDLGAETPAEIAVAIAAELVSVRRRGAASAGDWRPVRTHRDEASAGQALKLGAVILAAGAGSRLGGAAKALLRIGNHSYLEQAVRVAREVGLVEAVVVVAAPFGQAVAAHAQELGLRVVVNPDPSRGMASSVALGFAAIAETCVDAAWLWPVDHPFVTSATLQALRAALGDHAVARPRLAGRGGHPPLVARALWSQLAGCADLEGGARGVLAAADVVEVEVDDVGVLRDVDTPEDARASG